MKTWVTADWHLGETRFELMHRPFDDPTSHVAALRRNHNKLVAPEDDVYVLGDVFYKEADAEKWQNWLPLFNGRKVLVRGNHDRHLPDSFFEPHFFQIVQEGDGIEAIVDDIPVYMTHYPTCGRKDRFNLVGHIHSIWKVQLNMYNVGVDVHHFNPVDLATIPRVCNAISGFYDLDAWVAYDEINQSHWADRGKKTRYFTKVC